MSSASVGRSGRKGVGSESFSHAGKYPGLIVGDVLCYMLQRGVGDQGVDVGMKVTVAVVRENILLELMEQSYVGVRVELNLRRDL